MAAWNATQAKNVMTAELSGPWTLTTSEQAAAGGYYEVNTIKPNSDGTGTTMTGPTYGYYQVDGEGAWVAVTSEDAGIEDFYTDNIVNPNSDGTGTRMTIPNYGYYYPEVTWDDRYEEPVLIRRAEISGHKGTLINGSTFVE